MELSLPLTFPGRSWPFFPEVRICELWGDRSASFVSNDLRSLERTHLSLNLLLCMFSKRPALGIPHDVLLCPVSRTNLHLSRLLPC